MKRTIIVGDVHGCARELGRLLDRLELGAGDRLFFVGDLVMRGPKPNRVLRIVREAGGIAVRGNHEARLLLWRDLQRRRGKKEPSPEEARIGRSKMLRRTAAEIDEAGWELIERMPLWLEIPEQKILVVHAGLVPGVPLAKQAEHTLLYVRGVTDAGEPTDRRDEGVPWGKRYRGPPHVVFGHNAQREPQLHPWATGIDTGCVYGGRLTALVVPEGKTVPRGVEARRARLVSVKAKKIYEAVK